jgi:hypothetical protein
VSPSRPLTADEQAAVAAAVAQADQACAQALASLDPRYHGFVTFLEQSKKVRSTAKKDAVHAVIRQPYLTVDGRLQLAHDEHRAHGAHLVIQTDFERNR